MDRRRLVGIVVLIVLVGGVIVALISALGGDDDESSAPTTTTTTTLPPGPEARGLSGLLDKSRERTYHVRFKGASGDPQAASTALELWRDGSSVRQDVIYGSGADETRVASFVVGSRSVSCSKTPGKDWLCQEFSQLQSDQGTPVGLVEAAAADLGGAEVVEKAETIAGQAGRCFAITRAAGDKSEVCLTEEGIPLRVSVGGTVFDAESIEESVDGDTFTPPAKITQATSPPTTRP
jgi:hypothetical protein